MNPKKWLWLLIILAGIGLLYGIYFNKGRITKSADTHTRTITDMVGQEVTMADPLQRIALLGGPTGQVAFILGVEDRLCAVTNTLRMSKLVREVHPSIKDLPGPRTTAGSINIEALIASRPDVVIATSIDGNIVKSKTRIPVALLDDSMGEGIGDIKKEIQFYAHVFQTQERADAYVRELEKITRLVTSRTKDIPAEEKKVVFQGYSPSHLVTLGGDTFMQERIDMAGCINAARSVTTIGKRTGLHSGLGEVSMEQVLDWNPDILVINYGSIDELKDDPQWGHIKAVKQGAVFSQPAGVFIFNRPTAESAAVFPLWLASTAYPERFSDVSVPKIVKNFYKTVMNFDLTDRQVLDILSGVYEFRMMKGIRHKN